jgi:nucleoid-associated protein EbfC
MFKGLGQLASLMKNAHAIQGRMQEMQESLKRIRVEGSAGGGMVTVEMNAQQQMLGCRIEDGVFSSGDREVLEDLIVAATNQALERAKQAAADEMQKLAEGLDFPGMGDALSRLGGGGLGGP